MAHKQEFCSYLYLKKLSMKRGELSLKACANWFKQQCPTNQYRCYFSFQRSFSLSTILPRMNVMLDFICMEPVDLPGSCRKRHDTKWKILAHSGTRTYNLEICSSMLFRLSSSGFYEKYLKITIHREWSFKRKMAAVLVPRSAYYT